MASGDRITKTQRWLDLIAFLLGRRVPVVVEEIMERLPAYAEKWASGDATARSSVRRMFERDKDGLRALGVPLETVAYSVNFGAESLEGYRITRRDFYLPYLRLLEREGRPGRGGGAAAPPELPLAPREAALSHDALRRMAELPAFPFAGEARSALRKLSFDLQLEPNDGAPVLWVERPGAAEVLETLRVLSAALLARRRVRFRYRGMVRGEATERVLAPYGLFFQRDWYLVGHDETRDALRVFRVARIAAPEPGPGSPKSRDYEIPADFRLESYLSREAWELEDGEGEALEALVRFAFPAAVLAAGNGEGELVEEAADGSAVRRFAVHQVNPFLRWVLSLEGEAEVLGPPELRAELARLAREVAGLYAEAAGG
jgi:proteasome accessory factor B